MNTLIDDESCDETQEQGNTEIDTATENKEEQVIANRDRGMYVDTVQLYKVTLEENHEQGADVLVHDVTIEVTDVGMTADVADRNLGITLVISNSWHYNLQ